MIWSPKSFSLPDTASGQPTQISKLDFGKHHIAITSEDGRLFMMGKGSRNELGLGAKVKEAKDPTEVEDLGPVKSVKCGEFHSIALTEDGDVYTWGFGGTMFSTGALGHGDTESKAVPTKVQALAGVKIVSVGASHHHCLALSADGQVFTWGKGEYGVLGNGASVDAAVPVPIASLSQDKIAKIACGEAFSGALTVNGRLHMWGRNDGGQLGQPEGLSLDIHNIETVPTQCEVIKDLKEKVIDIALGERHTVALTDQGEAWMWGLGQWLVPQLVRGNDSVILGMNITQIAACNGVSAVVDEEGYLFTWGHGITGCLGQGDSKTHLQPLLLEQFGPGSELGPVKRIFANNAFMAVLT